MKLCNSKGGGGGGSGEKSTLLFCRKFYSELSRPTEKILIFYLQFRSTMYKTKIWIGTLFSIEQNLVDESHKELRKCEEKIEWKYSIKRA